MEQKGHRGVDFRGGGLNVSWLLTCEVWGLGSLRKAHAKLLKIIKWPGEEAKALRALRLYQ